MDNIKGFTGQHCESTATGTLLNQLGIELSEPMLFGLGEGLGFIFWNMKQMDFPFIGGRIKPDALTANMARNLGLQLQLHETASSKKAWIGVKELLDRGSIVGLKLDCYHLEYFSNPFHFAAHYVAIYGYDDQWVYLVDTVQQGQYVKTSLPSLVRARAEKGPMSSRNLYYTLRRNGDLPAFKDAILLALRNNARDFLNPPIANFGFRGILKAGKEIEKWFNRSKNAANEFSMTAMLMEKGGTGGALFRNLYRDFLKESHELLGYSSLLKAYQAFAESALLWNQVSGLFEKVNKREGLQYIKQASLLLRRIAGIEREGMEYVSAL